MPPADIKVKSYIYEGSLWIALNCYLEQLVGSAVSQVDNKISWSGNVEIKSPPETSSDTTRTPREGMDWQLRMALALEH